MAGAFKVVFTHTEVLKSKINNKGFLDLLKTNYVFSSAESWTGFDTCNIKSWRL